LNLGCCAAVFANRAEVQGGSDTENSSGYKKRKNTVYQGKKWLSNETEKTKEGSLDYSSSSQSSQSQSSSSQSSSSSNPNNSLTISKTQLNPQIV
jgi:hypothetical protein